MVRTFGVVVAVVAGFMSCTAHAQSDNLLQNPGFDAGGETPNGWTVGNVPDGVMVRRDDRIRRGEADGDDGSLRFVKRARNFWPYAEVSQRVDRVEGAGAVEVGAWVRAKRVSKLVIDVQFAGGGQTSHEWAAYVGSEGEGDPAANHDWTEYAGTVKVPEWAETVTVAFQLYGPGTAWIDDAYLRFTDGDGSGAGDEDTGTVLPESAEIDTRRLVANGDQQMRYMLHVAKDAGDEPRPLLLVLPGGAGGADFEGFVRNIAGMALGGEYVVAQLVAPVWRDDENRIVWPTKGLPDGDARFTTEEFIAAVIDDVSERAPVDTEQVYLLGWSSGGPPVYTATLTPGLNIRGAFVAMSVYHPDQMPPLAAAKGKRFYILHSPEDFIQMRFPERAKRELGRAGAEVKLETYAGGHGWHGDVFGMIAEGMRWVNSSE